jgi:hypothetical protein
MHDNGGLAVHVLFKKPVLCRSDIDAAKYVEATKQHRHGRDGPGGDYAQAALLLCALKCSGEGKTDFELFWRAYQHLLPNVDHMTTPLLMTESELDWLQVLVIPNCVSVNVTCAMNGLWNQITSCKGDTFALWAVMCIDLHRLPAATTAGACCDHIRHLTLLPSSTHVHLLSGVDYHCSYLAMHVYLIADCTQ